ncbi:MAG: putative Ig domain-containing protein [Fibrobacterota bacterium]
MMNHYKTMFVLIAAFAVWTTAIGAEQNVQVLYSAAECSTYFATTGAENISASYPIIIDATSPYDSGGNPWIKEYQQGSYSGLTAQPPVNDYHNILDWYHQRYTQLLDDELSNRSAAPRNWSAYNYIRFDVYSTLSDATLGMLVKDASGPTLSAQHVGMYTPVAKFRVPAGQWSTCNFPLKALADIGELDLTRIQGFSLRFDGYFGDTELRIENIRLVGSGAPDYPLVEMEGDVKPFGRKVVKNLLATRDKQKLVRNLSPVTTAIGPLTVLTAPCAYACALGHFGGSGTTYYQNLRRGVVAYDNDRLLFLSKSCVAGALQSKSTMTEGYGILAMGSFDGGQTWGGITRGVTKPTNMSHWYWRALASADYFLGSIYFTGAQNCASYHPPVDIFFRRLVLTGDGWAEDRFSILGQIIKCPGFNSALMLPNGRIWANIVDGWGGTLGKYSDDDGYTWAPCKNSSLPGSTQNPRPWYQPGVDPIPDSVLIFPGTVIPGSVFLPYGTGVANFSLNGGSWKIHNGTAWESSQTIPSWGGFNSNGYSELTGTAIDNDHLFLCKGGKYSDVNGGQPTDLVVNHLARGGSWQTDVLESGQVTESILTASGNQVYCFYVDNRTTVKYRKWKEGTWEAAVTLSTGTIPINRLAAPVFCPPTYAAVFWDQFGGSTNVSTWIKFAKIPADNKLIVANWSLFNGIVDQAYTARIQAAGGTVPYTWSLVSGALPAGLVLSDSGDISGTPTQTGAYTFRVKVTDANADTASRELAIKITGAGLIKSELSRPAAFSANLRSLPNPFTASTAIEYQLANSAQVSLSIYDRTGRLVRHFAEGNQPAGIYRVNWKPVQQAAGIYYIRLKAGDYTATKMMVLVK